jgi:pectate lyase
MKSFAFVALSLALFSPALAQAVDELVGFGAGTTGGGNATPITVTTCADLEAAVDVEGAAVVHIEGLISDCGVIDIQSDKTILGSGSGRYDRSISSS